MVDEFTCMRVRRDYNNGSLSAFSTVLYDGERDINSEVRSRCNLLIVVIGVLPVSRSVRLCICVADRVALCTAIDNN